MDTLAHFIIFIIVLLTGLLAQRVDTTMESVPDAPLKVRGFKH